MEKEEQVGGDIYNIVSTIYNLQYIIQRRKPQARRLRR